MAAYLVYSLRTKTLFCGWPIMVNDYGNATPTGLPAYQYRRLQSVLNAAARLIYRRRRFDFWLCHVALTGTALVEVVGASCLQVGSDILLVPLWLSTDLPRSERPSCSWVGPSSPTIVIVWWHHHSDNQTVGDRAFTAAGSWLWNSLPPDITSAQTLPVFCNRLKTYLFSKCFPT